MAVATGERRIVSVLVADIAGSTRIGEQLGPERSKLLFDEVIRLIATQIEAYGGTIAQLAGDGVLALFGAPVAHEDDSERAVRAGLAIQRALAKYADEVEQAYGVELAVRIGVNTGPVVVSPAEEDGGLRYNALGDAVNVAARLEKTAGAGGVAIDVTTARQVEGSFELEPLGELELKGKSAPVRTFRVTGIREEYVAEPALPLVGRDFELSVLERVIEGLVEEGRGAIVSIVGEPGIGKSRLGAEARRRYRDSVRFVEGRAVSYAQSFPYWPVRDLLREWLGVGAATPEARVRLELKAQLAQFFGEEAEDAYPFFARLAGITLEPGAADRLRELNRESVQRRTFEVVFELVCRLGEEQPLCLVLEDLHWADESTLHLVQELLGVTEESAVALLLLYRSEREHGSWRLGERARARYPHRYREIELRPLPADASRALAANAAGGGLPDSVAELLAERSGGNPFFLEEALRDLVERGMLRREDGRWELAVGVDELAVPTLLQAALQARLDRLDPKTREVLGIAAVIGRTFGMPLLERILPHDELVPALSELQRLDLIVERRRRPAPEYRFRHGLVQEVAYAGLVESKRRRLHKVVGEALESLYRESPEEAYGLLARHFAEADEPEKAAEYLLKAGDAARAVYADQEALEHYSRAREFLARLGDDRRARETLFKMALAHHLAFDFERAEDMYDEAFCCKVEEPPRVEPTERLEIALVRPDAFVPGEVYSTEGAQFTEHLFRGLLMVDRELNVVPAMADNMRVSSDGLTYLFRLREGVRWWDGEPLTAEDFAFAWRRMREERTRTAFLMEDVETAEALDERTLEIRLREPRNYFPYILASPWAFPWPRHKCEELGDDWRNPENLVGNGPFMLAELDDEGALMAANRYWAGPRGNVREVGVSFKRSDDEALEDWLAGRYDMVHLYDARARHAPDTVAELVPELSLTYVGFRADRPPFSSALVRKAFSHAIDRERLVAAPEHLSRAATRGGAIPPAMPGHSHRVAPEYDVDLARRLLGDAGYPEGRGLPTLTMIVKPGFAIGERLIEQWAELGARVDSTEAGDHLEAWMVEDHDVWVSGWTADYPDPDGFFRGLFQSGWPFHLDDDLVELVARARSLRDQDERMRLYHEVDRLWVCERAAILPLFYARGALVRRPWVTGLWANTLSRAHLDDAVVTRRPGSDPR